MLTIVGTVVSNKLLGYQGPVTRRLSLWVLPTVLISVLTYVDSGTRVHLQALLQRYSFSDRYRADKLASSFHHPREGYMQMQLLDCITRSSATHSRSLPC